MLTPQDDFIGHQAPSTYDQPISSDLRFTERYWYSGHLVPEGDIIFDFGLGHYPNRNVMDAFAGITVEGRQYNWRGSRRLHGQAEHALQTKVGPLRFEILEGLRTHRIVLESNESGFSFDLRYIASTEPAQEKQSFRRRLSRVDEDLVRMVQFGRWEGWLEVAGKRYDIKPDQWWGQRDHSWGIRSEMKTDFASPPMQSHSNILFLWCMYQFEDFGICLFNKERVPGEPSYLSGTEMPRLGSGRKVRHITSLGHELRWKDDPLGQTLSGADLCFKFDDGSKRELQLECLPGRYYLKGGLYGGYGGWNHGDDRGNFHSEHDIWDLGDPLTRERARTLGDHVCRVTSEGAVGYGISEYGVATGYPKYAIPQKHPAF